MKTVTAGTENVIQTESQSKNKQTHSVSWYTLHEEMFYGGIWLKFLAPARQPLTPSCLCMISNNWNAPHTSLYPLHILQTELILAGMCWVSTKILSI